MEKDILTRMTILVVAITLVAALGAALWRASYQSRGELAIHQYAHHSMEVIPQKPAWA